MRYSILRQQIVTELTNRFEQYRTGLFDQQAKGDVHKTASDYLYMMRVNQLIFDHMVMVNFVDFMNCDEGFEVDIKVWHEQGAVCDNFVLFVKPLESTTEIADDEDPIAAYERAMRIL